MRRRDFLIASLGAFFQWAGLLDLFRKAPLPKEGSFTPVEDLYVVDIRGTPGRARDVERSPSTYGLRVYGYTEKDLLLTLDRIRAMPSERRDVILECVDNPRGRRVGRIRVKGVRLSHILRMAGMREGAVDVVFRAMDGYHTSLDTGYILQHQPLLVYAINYDERGETIGDLPLDHGYPIRVISPGKWGYKSPKWVEEIEVVNYDYRGYWEEKGWSDRGRYKVDYLE